MIDPEYVRTFAQYNEWQNTQLLKTMRGLNQEVLFQERGAYFGSIFATANHVLWSDQLWMSRFAGFPAPTANYAKGTEMSSSLEDWAIQRFRLDQAICDWSNRIKAVDLTGELSWFSVVNQREYTRSKGLCVVHMFNHQTHHRGQLHVMLTAVGCEGATSDLTFMSDAEDCVGP
ncbi:DinB family protein [uncultured Pelagimonas sp.]|uniref:DinB family protein n=1 Tax=uncultured Pelagimonas sp. TaxID=1618102 RepID=UPI002605F4AB|nr:DinB family protein [uncultured Pelagimonas sp.]